jgi:hypothetical protein
MYIFSSCLKYVLLYYYRKLRSCHDTIGFQHYRYLLWWACGTTLPSSSRHGFHPQAAALKPAWACRLTRSSIDQPTLYEAERAGGGHQSGTERWERYTRSTRICRPGFDDPNTTRIRRPGSNLDTMRIRRPGFDADSTRI